MADYLWWAVQWRSRANSFFIGNYPDSPYHLFKTKREAEEFIREKYGYIAKRPDLRRKPHHWRMPQAVLVNVTLEVM